MATRICGIASKTVQSYYYRPIFAITLPVCNRNGVVLCCRQQHSQQKQSDSKNLAVETKKPDAQVTIGEKVKQTTKDAYYGSIIIAGVGVTCLLFYAIFRELFSKESPNGIYTKSLNICLETPRLVDALGQPVKGYGKTTSRGRRRHPSYVEYVQDGVNHIRMKFYVEGSRRKGTVHLEVKQNSNGKYEYRYLFVELSDFPKETIIIQDNRSREISV